MVRVLEQDPELGRHLPDCVRAAAVSAAIAPVLSLDRGTTPLLIDERETYRHLGLLVLDGLIARHVSFGRIGSAEFHGPGDLLRPWQRGEETSEIIEVRWEVLAPARLAALDGDFAARVRRWPEVTAALLDRAARRHDTHLLQAALHQARLVEDRVLLALWHFAGRWGHVGPEGRIVSLPNITGELLAHYIGASRQSLSTALGRLADRGAVRRRADGSLVLTQPPPELATVAPGPARR